MSVDRWYGVLWLLWLGLLCGGLPADEQPAALEEPASFLHIATDRVLTFISSLTNPRRSKRDNGGSARLSWQHCGSDRDPVVIERIHLTPNPVEIPGRIEAGVKVDVRMDQISPIKAKIKMQKKIPLLFGYSSWITVPCYSNGLGSCTYPDICNTRLLQSGRSCPSSLQAENIPCACPFKQGVYELPPLLYNVPPPPRSVPKYFLEGEFNVKFLLSRGNYPLACYETNVVLDL